PAHRVPGGRHVVRSGGSDRPAESRSRPHDAVHERRTSAARRALNGAGHLTGRPMAIGVSLWFDDALEARVRALWRMIAERGISRVLHDGPYRPHVTLGVWERLDLERFVPALRALAGSIPPVPIALASAG